MQIHIQPLDRWSWERHADAIMRIEADSYEPTRRDSREFFSDIVARPRSVCATAAAGGEIAGFCFGAALESFPEVRGTQTDPEWGKGTTVYSADLTVAARFRGQGIARRLKSAQLDLARHLGYQYFAGRNRVGLAEQMWRINCEFNAYQVQYLKDDYDDEFEPRDCIYYHIDL